MKETFKEKAEIFAMHYGWENTFENDHFTRYTNGTGWMINIYPNGTVYPAKSNVKTQSYKKASDAVLENVFADPYKNPYHVEKLPVRSKETPKATNLIPVLELIEKIDALEKRVVDFEQALIDHKIINV